MGSSASDKQSKVAFGDFQTPPDLAKKVCALLSRRGVKPSTVLEPNCGRGSFLLACLNSFPGAKRLIGVDINPEYVAALQATLNAGKSSVDVRVLCSDFYKTKWGLVLDDAGDPVLVVGNPPWVTNAGLGAIGALNLPEKSNFQNHTGFDALTGKSNFDISEWMIVRESEWLNGRQGTLAMLCKTAVARKVLFHVWKNSMQISRSDTYAIDAMGYFGAAVDACLLVCDFAPDMRNTECLTHRSLEDEAGGKFGFRDGRLVSDVSTYERWSHLSGGTDFYRWRSGIKHDCAEVMELRKSGELYENGLGEILDLEPDYLYPMLKSSQLAKGPQIKTDRWMVVTQKLIGEGTNCIQSIAPKTWDYLQRHAQRFRQRASSIYKKRPQFSIFGVGEYSFAPWKVATSAFYKKLEFKVVPPIADRPVVFDDTCYFVPCQSQEEAERLSHLLNSDPARDFYNSLISWDAKRPLTIEILRQLDLIAVGEELGLAELNNQIKGQTLDLFSSATRR